MHDMPMRHELSIPPMRPIGITGPKRDLWAVIGFCLIGLLTSIYFAFSATPLDEIPLFVMQYNLG
jgi:hypothetical protein